MPLPARRLPPPSADTALKDAEPRRAKEALVLCELLGPTFIKLGQALSIRTDLIPAAYALELRQLQVMMPPTSLPSIPPHPQPNLARSSSSSSSQSSSSSSS